MLFYNFQGSEQMFRQQNFIRNSASWPQSAKLITEIELLIVDQWWGTKVIFRLRQWTPLSIFYNLSMMFLKLIRISSMDTVIWEHKLWEWYLFRNVDIKKQINKDLGLDLIIISDKHIIKALDCFLIRCGITEAAKCSNGLLDIPQIHSSYLFWCTIYWYT